MEYVLHILVIELYYKDDTHYHSETLILCSLSPQFPWFYARFYQSRQNFHKNAIRFSLNIQSYLLSNSSTMFQLTINWHTATVLSTFNWKSWEREREKKNVQLQFHTFSIVFVLHVPHSANSGETWLNYHNGPFLQHGDKAQTRVGSSAKKLHCMMWINIHYKHGINTQWLPSLLLSMRCAAVGRE
jgi:hypothetical protein